MQFIILFVGERRYVIVLVSSGFLEQDTVKWVTYQ